MRRRRATIVLMGTLLLFAAACGEPTQEVTDQPGGPGDEVTASPDAGDDRDGPDGATGDVADAEAADERATSLLGLTEAEARGREGGFPVRVGRRGDAGMALTYDLRPGRATLTLEQQEGDWVVTAATVEHREGGITVER